MTTRPLSGQASTAAVQGVVADSQDAGIPAAIVTATNTATGVSKTVMSEKNGDSSINNLDPGSYEIEVRSAGFSNSKVTGVTLAIASTSESVSVQTYSIPLVDTDTSAVGGDR